MEYYSAIRNNEYPPFALKWMELEGIMLSEVTIAYKMDGNSAEEKVKTSAGHAQAGENDSTHFEIR
jgi:hypothetical protein